MILLYTLFLVLISKKNLFNKSYEWVRNKLKKELSFSNLVRQREKLENLFLDKSLT